jgi:hypothetical protein
MVKVNIYYNDKDITDHVDIGISPFEFLMFGILILICGLILGYFVKTH